MYFGLKETTETYSVLWCGFIHVLVLQSCDMAYLPCDDVMKTSRRAHQACSRYLKSIICHLYNSHLLTVFTFTSQWPEYFPAVFLGCFERSFWISCVISDSAWRRHCGSRLCSALRMRVHYSVVEGDMATSLICGRLTASLRNSGARNTLSSASKVSVCPHWSEGLRLSEQVSVTAPLLLWRPQFAKNGQGQIWH